MLYVQYHKTYYFIPSLCFESVRYTVITILTFSYQIVDNETKEAAVVDPVEPEHVLAELKGKDIKLTKILTTHHHW